VLVKDGLATVRRSAHLQVIDAEALLSAMAGVIFQLHMRLAAIVVPARSYAADVGFGRSQGRVGAADQICRRPCTPNAHNCRTRRYPIHQGGRLAVELSL